MLWIKLKRKFYLLQYRIKIFWMRKISLKYKGYKKSDKLIHDCSRLTDRLIDQIKGPFNITAKVIDPELWDAYKEFSQSIDTARIVNNVWLNTKDKCDPNSTSLKSGDVIAPIRDDGKISISIDTILPSSAVFNRPVPNVGETK